MNLNKRDVKMEGNKERNDTQACRRTYTVSEIWSKYRKVDYGDDDDFHYGLDRCGFSNAELITLIEILTVMRND